MVWAVAGWLLIPFLAKAGPEKAAQMRRRVASGITTTFASSFTGVVSLTEALDPSALATYGRLSTGQKHLLTPQQVSPRRTAAIDDGGCGGSDDPRARASSLAGGSCGATRSSRRCRCSRGHWPFAVQPLQARPVVPVNRPTGPRSTIPQRKRPIMPPITTPIWRHSASTRSTT